MRKYANGEESPINGQLAIQDASSNCPCFCFCGFSPWTLKVRSALFWGEEKWEREGGGKYKLDYDAGKERFFTISANCETFGSKGGLFDEIDWFYGLKPGWKSVILCIVLPFLLIMIDSCMIDLYHYVQRRDLYYSNDCTILFDLIMIVIYICPIVTDYTINLIIICLTIRLIRSTAWLTLANLYYLSNDDCYLCFDKTCSFLLDNKTRQKKFFLIISAIPLIGF